MLKNFNVALPAAFLLYSFAGYINPQTVEGQSNIPGRFVYDPVAGESSPLSEDDLQKAHTIKTSLDTESSFTLEAFARPGADLDLRSREFMPVFRTAGDKAFVVVGVRRSPPPHSYSWWHTRIQTGKDAGPVDFTRPRYGGISMVRGDSPWRHVAFTWDAEKLTASFYLDYQLQQQSKLDAQPDWNLAEVQLGEGEGMKPFLGGLAAPRVSRRALPPWQFQRASSVELANVSFQPESKPTLPTDYGHVDVRLHYGAVGDGKHDDTAAIRRAFAENENRVPIEYQTVYFPAGEYLISDSIRFSRFMVVRGAGREKTIIRLKDHADGYANPDVPKPAFAVGYDWPYVNRTKKQRAGNAIGSYIMGLSIDTGSGNPSALGLDFHCNNHGCVENIDIRSGDGQGKVGLDLKRGWPGPCLFKNVSITGFDTGIDAAHREYSLVFSGVRLKNQRVAAIANGGNVLSMENVESHNAVPAVINRGGGLVLMVNSQLKGGSKEGVAISSENASLYLRNVAVEGYGASLLETTKAKDGQQTTLAHSDKLLIEEYSTGPTVSAFDNEQGGSLKLPIKPTPDLPLPPIDDWVNVRRFENLVAEGDWSPAIQAAVDSGKSLVYFPDGKYSIKSDVVIRGAVRTFLGGSPKTSIASGEAEHPEDAPAFILDGGLPIFKFHMLAAPHVRHDTPTTLILKHCNCGRLSAGADCGDLFVENAGGKFRFNKHQRVWARQLNPETKGIPEIINDGGTLWMLGLKTEYLSTKIVNQSGAKTELLGGLMYPVHPVEDETLPMFINEESDISLIHGVSVYRKNHKIYMRDTQEGQTRTYTDWHWISGRPIVNLYNSRRARE